MGRALVLHDARRDVVADLFANVRLEPNQSVVVGHLHFLPSRLPIERNYMQAPSPLLLSSTRAHPFAVSLVPRIPSCWWWLADAVLRQVLRSKGGEALGELSDPDDELTAPDIEAYLRRHELWNEIRSVGAQNLQATPRRAQWQ